MIPDSKLLSKHHYYVQFFQSTFVDSISSLKIAFPFLQKAEHRILLTNNESDKVFHLQIMKSRAYGSEDYLIDNVIDENGTPYYVYDLFFGSFVLDGIAIHYLCYPYKKFGKELRGGFERHCSLYGPNFESFVKYIMNRQSLNRSIEDVNVSTNIIKYLASVGFDTIDEFEDIIYIQGSDPLNSQLYKEILKLKDISITHLAGKISFQTGSNELNLSFDRIGNYRFYIPKGGTESALSLLSYAFTTFYKSESLNTEIDFTLTSIFEYNDF